MIVVIVIIVIVFAFAIAAAIIVGLTTGVIEVAISVVTIIAVVSY